LRDRDGPQNVLLAAQMSADVLGTCFYSLFDVGS